MVGGKRKSAGADRLRYIRYTTDPLVTNAENRMKARRILLGITGSVAVYKAAELTRLLVKAGHEVEVAMSESACRLVTPHTFQALSGRPVVSSLWDDRTPNAMGHIDLTRRTDAMLIVPASANILAKIANGICDELISTLAAARNCPLAVAPAMNRQMWLNPANLRNVEQLRRDGVQVFGPAEGDQACGEVGAGRMLEPTDIVDLLERLWQPPLLAGRRVLLTAGPTLESIDPVRALTNLSSGKMGYALARACRDAGAEVTLISGPTRLDAPAGMTTLQVESAQQMHDAVMAQVDEHDLFISVAAVADYRVAQRAETKIKKGKQLPTLQLVENPDILATVAALPNAPFCVGFAAESEQLLNFAEQKRLKKRLPLLVANLVQDALGGDDSKVVLLDDNGQHPLPAANKRTLANEIVAHMAGLLAESN